MFKNKPSIPHPSMSSRFKNSNAENIRFGALRNNVISSDIFQWNPSRKISIDPPTSDNQRPSSGRGNKNNWIIKRSFLHSVNELDKDIDSRLTK